MPRDTKALLKAKWVFVFKENIVYLCFYAYNLKKWVFFLLLIKFCALNVKIKSSRILKWFSFARKPCPNFIKR